MDQQPNAPITTAPALATKPAAGIVSSEFLATALSSVAMIWSAVDNLIPPQTAAIVVTVAVAVYTICRTALKAMHTLGLAKQVPDLPMITAEVKQ